MFCSILVNHIVPICKNLIIPLQPISCYFQASSSSVTGASMSNIKPTSHTNDSLTQVELLRWVLIVQLLAVYLEWQQREIIIEQLSVWRHQLMKKIWLPSSKSTYRNFFEKITMIILYQIICKCFLSKKIASSGCLKMNFDDLVSNIFDLLVYFSEENVADIFDRITFDPTSFDSRLTNDQIRSDGNTNYQGLSVVSNVDTFSSSTNSGSFDNCSWFFAEFMNTTPAYTDNNQSTSAHSDEVEHVNDN